MMRRKDTIRKLADGFIVVVSLIGGQEKISGCIEQTES